MATVQSRMVRMGIRELAYPGPDLGQLHPSNDLLGDADQLRQRMAEDGYLYFQGLIDRGKVLAARARILEFMNDHEALEPGSRPLDGVMGQYGKSVNLFSRRSLYQEPVVRNVLEADELFQFFNGYFGRPSMTFSYKWLRAVGNERFTGAHYDVIYMGRGSADLNTCWIPFGDLELEQGTLAICRGSHNAPGFQKLRDTYGRMDVDRDLIEGWFTRDPLEVTGKFGGQWLTTPYRAGDVLIFGMYSMHASTTNVTDRWRLSCDVRFQPAEDPVDERWQGDNPTGHYAWSQQQQQEGKVKPMSEARTEWGV